MTEAMRAVVIVEAHRAMEGNQVSGKLVVTT